MTTIGEASHKMAQEYIEVYESLRNDKDERLRAKAANLARHDILARQLVAEFALRELDGYIKSKEVEA